MTDPNLGRKKKKITYKASSQGLEKAQKALLRLGFESKSNFAESQLLSRSTVTKFFQCQPIQLDSFKRICDALKLNWKEIAFIIEEEQSETLEIKDCSTPDMLEGVDPLQTLRRIVTVTDEQSQTIKAAITLQGDIDSVQNWKILESILREYSGNTIKIIDIKEGSIKLIIEGSQEDIERLVSLIESGELTEVDGFPVEDAQILSESSDDGENAEPAHKWRLVQEIVNQPVAGRDLSGADLSDADLSNANLINADLSDADLSNADLSNANLKDANLRGADLRGSNLSNANLKGAYLHDAIIDQTTRTSDKWRDVQLITNETSDNNKSVSYDQSPVHNSNPIGVKFILTNLIRGNLCGAFQIFKNLTRANLIGANLIGANLSRADLSGANLSGANLTRANLIVANLIVANLIGANLSRANLSDADLSRANLSHANLIGANLSRANLSDADLSRANLSDADLSCANLSGIYLSGADLSGADLSGADLSGADLRGIDLNDADLRDEINQASPKAIADLVRANMTKLKRSGVKNLQALARGEVLPTPGDFAIIMFTLGIPNEERRTIWQQTFRHSFYSDRLRDANLSGANLSGATVRNTRFGWNSGLTDDMKLDLTRRGAIFEDSPGDRSPTLKRT